MEENRETGLIYKVALMTGVACLAIGLILTSMGSGAFTGLFIIAFFVALGIGFRGYETLKGFSFTIMILGVVTTALYYPDYFTEFNGTSTSILIIPLLQIIMFGMGATMSLRAFIGVIKQPKGVILGFLLQFTIMPLVGFGLAKFSGFPPEIAAGIILVGCSPSGLASNVMAYLGKGNVPLSLTITSVNTLFAPILTPLLMALLAGTFVEIDTVAMMWSIMKIVILPVIAGIIFQEFLSGKAKWVDAALPKVSMVGIGIIVLVTSALGRDGLIELGIMLFFVVLAHNLSGYLLGYWSAKLLNMNETDCRTIAIEVGMQNAGLAKGIAQGMGKLATLGLAPLVFGPLMNVTGSMLAMYWHDNAPEGELDYSKYIETRNRFIEEMTRSGRLSPEALKGAWAEEVKSLFLAWTEEQPDEKSFTRQQLEELIQIDSDYGLNAPKKLK
ncbi:MAG: bile acid:sodium symporter family protein [Balneolaceae bacterium]